MSSSKEPLYVQIAQDLAQMMASGKYPPDSNLPTEMELCDHYQVSRHTIRSALRELSDSGLISRRKHAGTRVEKRVMRSTGEHSLASLEDLMTLAHSNQRIVKKVKTIVATRELAKTIGGAPGSQWLHIESIRENPEDKNAPICLTDSYVSTAYAKIGKLVKKYPFALISDLIEEYYGRRSVAVHQTITAVAISPAEARLLNAESGSPALRIIRRYADRTGKVFETTVSVHPAERYTCSIVLRRDGPTNSDSALGVFSA